MKLPVGFGSRLFYRVVVPGCIVAVALIKGFSPSIALGSELLASSVVFLVLAIISGLSFLFLDRPIYMLLEGRRYWPSRLWRLGIALERRRLLRLHRTMRQYNPSRMREPRSKVDSLDDKRRYLEAASEIADFPLDESTLFPVARWPTRLGNLINAYEQYPSLKYGLDSVFFWPRIWVAVNSELRLELDTYQSQGDGGVYGSLACCVAAAIIGIGSVWDAQEGMRTELMQLPWVAIFLILAFVLYRASLYSYQQFGELFMATFDIHQSSIENSAASEILENEVGLDFCKAGRRTRNLAIWRFLKWHRFRPAGRKRNERVRFDS